MAASLINGTVQSARLHLEDWNIDIIMTLHKTQLQMDKNICNIRLAIITWALVVQAFNPRTLEAEAGGSLWVWGQPGLQELVLGQPGLTQINPVSKKQRLKILKKCKNDIINLIEERVRNKIDLIGTEKNTNDIGIKNKN